VVDGHGDQFTGQRWLDQLSPGSNDVATLRGLVLLNRGVATVVIGSEMCTGSALVGRFPASGRERLRDGGT